MSAVLQNYAKQVRDGLRVGSGTPLFPHAALGLAGEAGEVSDLIKKSQYVGGELDFDRLTEELGDTLWYLQLFCNFLGITVEQLAMENIKKLAKRRPGVYTEIPE